MTISAKMIADSVSPEGIRICTLELYYPRFIHAEFMTHRDFSRNAGSSRAIPFDKLLNAILIDPAVPIHWGQNQSGMQAAEELPSNHRMLCHSLWLRGLHYTQRFAKEMFDVGLHKQVVNRMLEPWSHIKVVVTSTNWANFFALRDHPAAMPEIQALAKAIFKEMHFNIPTRVPHDGWHTPYVTLEERLAHTVDWCLKISVARCASVSYKTVDGLDMTWEKAIALFDKLMGNQPLHATPAEHQATPDSQYSYCDETGQNVHWEHPDKWGNFRGWIQYRKLLPGERVYDELYSGPTNNYTPFAQEPSPA